ncbi:hypothetical protein GCM10023340_20400 [Nocardioides marinquilinus]|uniref:Heparin binding hemagglutinin HbhA n=1 Tax=Nocardioides marinquilinus TaxID=1210400 RepID=A0ABP9PJG5_9ACTN
MAKTRIDFRSIELPAAAQKPVYAGVGAGDLAVTAVREYVADVSKRISGYQKQVSDLNAKKLRGTVENRVAELQNEALAIPTRVQTRVNDNVAALTGTVTGTYSDLAKRGEAVVKGTKLPSSATVEVKVNTTNPAARKSATKPVGAKASATTSGTTTTRKPAAKKTTAKKTTAKKTTAKKAPATKTVSDKATAAKATAEKTVEKATEKATTSAS